jgi:hypothetical protein
MFSKTTSLKPSNCQFQTFLKTSEQFISQTSSLSSASETAFLKSDSTAFGSYSSDLFTSVVNQESGHTSASETTTTSEVTSRLGLIIGIVCGSLFLLCVLFINLILLSRRWKSVVKQSPSNDLTRDIEFTDGHIGDTEGSVTFVDLFTDDSIPFDLTTTSSSVPVQSSTFKSLI